MPLIDKVDGQTDSFGVDHLLHSFTIPEEQMIASQIEIQTMVAPKIRGQIYTLVRAFIHSEPHIEDNVEKETVEEEHIWVLCNRWSKFWDALLPKYWVKLRDKVGIRYEKVITRTVHTTRNIRKIYNICPHFAIRPDRDHYEFLKLDPEGVYNRMQGAEYYVYYKYGFPGDIIMEKMPSYESALTFCKNRGEGAFIALKIVGEEDLRG